MSIFEIVLTTEFFLENVNVLLFDSRSVVIVKSVIIF